MKIGMTTFGGDGGKSGISRYIISLLEEFSHLNGEADFETLVYENEKDIFVPPKSGIKALTFGNSLRNPLVNVAWHQLALPGWCRKRKYDLLFLPAGNRRLPISLPCPSVGTVHDFSALHVEGKYDRARMVYIKKVLPFLIHKLTKVITVSESSKRDIVNFAGVPESNISVIPLAADSSVYYPRNNEESLSIIRKKYGIRQPYILYISRLEHPGKNHVRLINAFDRLKRAEKLPHTLVLAGSDWDRAEAVHRAAEDSSFSKDILFTGFTASEDLPFLYSGSDIFVFPSLYEGFGLPILEAMGCGAPVACSNISSMPEVAGQAAVLFDPYDESSIANSMGELLIDVREKERFTRLGIERCKEFNWSKTATLTLNVLSEALNTG